MRAYAQPVARICAPKAWFRPSRATITTFSRISGPPHRKTHTGPQNRQILHHFLCFSTLRAPCEATSGSPGCQTCVHMRTQRRAYARPGLGFVPAGREFPLSPEFRARHTEKHTLGLKIAKYYIISSASTLHKRPVKQLLAARAAKHACTCAPSGAHMCAQGLVSSQRGDSFHFLPNFGPATQKNTRWASKSPNITSLPLLQHSTSAL